MESSDRKDYNREPTENRRGRKPGATDENSGSAVAQTGVVGKQ